MSTAFAKHIRSTVDDFLQTVVMVDDEAYRPATARSDDEWTDGESSAPMTQVKLKPPTSPPAADDLDPRVTAAAFGKRGLACAMLSPQSEQENREIRNPLLRTARRADLVVLDWMLNGDDGKTTLRLFKGLLKKDGGVERRLRVVAVYTGEPKLHTIADDMRKIVGEVLPGEEILEDENGLPQFTCGPVRVTVLAKEFITNLPSDQEPQRTTIDKLPDRLADEFCRLCTGLVSSAAVSALTGIREEAHRLLTALGTALDPALLGQRVALNQPEDVERQLETLLSAEIAAIIADRQVGSMASLPRIKQWIADQPDLKPGGLIDDVTAKERLGFLRLGLGDDRITEQNELTGRRKAALRTLRGQATELFVLNAKTANDANRAFYERMVMRTRYTKPDPVLRLGTIVEQDGLYALCIQPVCDSVRLEKVTQFPFLSLQARNPQETGPGLIALRDPGKDNKWLHLGVPTAPSALMLVDFVPGAGEVVGSRKYGSSPSPRFKPAKGTKTWRWVADLKPDHAQRVVEQLGAAFSRVGLADPELLRLVR